MDTPHAYVLFKTVDSVLYRIEMTLILKIFISDGHIDGNFLEKNSILDRDLNPGL